MGKLVRSWNIFKKSLALISSKPKLLIFPLCSFFAMLFLLLLICGGIAVFFIYAPPESLQQTAASAGGEESLHSYLAGTAAFFLIYLATMLVSNLCLTAFFHEIIGGLKGEKISVSGGFGFAFRRFPAIFLWSLLASTIGVILQALQEKAGLLGKFVLKLIGIGWAVASCFAIPVIVCNESLLNPIDALKKSALAIKHSWGEALIGFAGLHILTGTAGVCWLLLTVLLGAGAIALQNTVLSVAAGCCVALLFLALLVFCYFVNVAQHIYQAALYLYSQGGDMALFSEEELAGAFRKRKS